MSPTPPPSPTPGGITFDNIFNYLTNPLAAGDYGIVEIPYTNDTGETVTDVVYSGSYPFQVMGFTTGVVKVKADSDAGILPQGLAEQSVSFSFKGSAGDLATTQTNVEVMATIKAKLQEENDKTPPPYMAELTGSLSEAFGQNASSSGLFTSSQVSQVELTAAAGLNSGGLSATIQTKIGASFDSLSPSDIVSVKRSASVQLSYTDKSFQFAAWSTSANVSATWTSLSSNVPDIKATGTVSLKNVDSGSKVLDTVLEALYLEVSSTAPGGAELGYALQHNTEFIFGIRWRIIQD